MDQKDIQQEENGARFTTPISPRVVTQAIGRGTTRLERTRYASARLAVLRSRVIMYVPWVMNA